MDEIIQQTQFNPNLQFICYNGLANEAKHLEHFIYHTVSTYPF